MNSRNFNIVLLCNAFLFLSAFSVQANENSRSDADSTTHRVAKREKNARYSILGGPGYTPDFGVLIGGSALATFRIDTKDTISKRSVVPLAFSISFGNGLGFALVSRPQLFFNNDRMRIWGQLIYKYTGDNYYGVSYATNKDRDRGDATTFLHMQTLQVNPVISFRYKESDFFIGPMADLIFEKITKPSAGVLADSHYVEVGGDDKGLYLQSIGVGFSLSYDTRDIPANAYNGMLIDLKALYAPSFLGSTYEYGSINFDYRQYLALGFMGKRRVLAWTFNSRNSFGDVPFTRLSMAGSPFDLRGYYMGQYRDRSVHVGVVEYRHMFNTAQNGFWSRLANRFGYTGWVGMGLIGPSPLNIEGVLPNFGAGLRIELQPRMNFRLDVGYSAREKQTLFYFNMTEAF